MRRSGWSRWRYLSPTKPYWNNNDTNYKKWTKRVLCFYCNKYGHYKTQCQKLKRDKWQETKRQNGQFNPNRPLKPKCDTCGKPHKTEDCLNGANAANDPRPKRHTAAPSKASWQNHQHHYNRRRKKLKLTRLRFGDNVDARAYSIEDTPTQYNHDSSQICNGHPTQNWQRRREIAAIKKYNSRHSIKENTHRG